MRVADIRLFRFKRWAMHSRDDNEDPVKVELMDGRKGWLLRGRFTGQFRGPMGFFAFADEVQAHVVGEMVMVRWWVRSRRRRYSTR